jgi:hypothetical protein
MAYALRRRRKHPLDPSRRRHALALLADAGVGGVTEALMLANGVTVETTVELVRDGLATFAPQRVKAGRKRMEVAVLRIAEAGRRALGA